MKLEAELGDVFLRVDHNKDVVALEDLLSLGVNGFVSTQQIDLESVRVRPSLCGPSGRLAVDFTVGAQQEQAIDSVAEHAREDTGWRVWITSGFD